MKYWITLFFLKAILAPTITRGQPHPCAEKSYAAFSLSFNNIVVTGFNKWLGTYDNSSTNNFFVSQIPSDCGIAYDSLISISTSQTSPVYIINLTTLDTLVIQFPDSNMQSGYYGRINFLKGSQSLTVPQKTIPLLSLTVAQIDSLKNYKSYNIYRGEIINCTDTFNRKQGKWITFGKDAPVYSKSDLGIFPDSAIFGIGYYKDNKMNGTAKCFFPDGKIRYVTKYTNNNLDSAYITYFNDGCIQSKEYFKNHMAYGTWEWFDSCDCLRYKEERDGRQVIKTYYYKNCKLQKTSSQIATITSDNYGWQSSNPLPYQIAEGEFLNDNLYSGQKKFYDSKGNIIKTEVYYEGNLIETK